MFYPLISYIQTCRKVYSSPWVDPKAMLVGALCTFLNTCTFMFIPNLTPLLLMEPSFGIVDANGDSVNRNPKIFPLEVSTMYKDQDLLSMYRSNGINIDHSLGSNTYNNYQTNYGIKERYGNGWCENVTTGISTIFSAFSSSQWLNKLSEYFHWESGTYNSVTGTSTVLSVVRRLQEGGDSIAHTSRCLLMILWLATASMVLLK